MAHLELVAAEAEVLHVGRVVVVVVLEETAEGNDGIDAWCYCAGARRCEWCPPGVRCREDLQESAVDDQPDQRPLAVRPCDIDGDV